jgi:hypothetical protein
MVGNQPARGGDDAASNALMSLLREGGQWDDTDDKRIRGSELDLKGEDEDEWSKGAERNSVVCPLPPVETLYLQYLMFSSPTLSRLLVSFVSCTFQVRYWS